MNERQHRQDERNGRGLGRTAAAAAGALVSLLALASLGQGGGWRPLAAQAGPPVFQTVSPASGTITAATQVTVSGTVDSAVSVTVAGQAATLVGGTSFSGGPVALAEGTNNLTLTAVDAAGNSASTALVVVRDTTPPAVAIGAPAAGTVLAAVAVDVTGTASDVHLANVAVNGIAASVTGGQFRAPQVPLSEGSTVLTAVATDQAGNVSQSSVTVVRDTQPPTLAITNPADGTVVPGASLTVSGVASDPHLARVVVNGAVATLVPQAGGAAAAWSAPVSLQAGSNTVTAQAVDAAGNASTATITVVRNSSVPQVSITQPADGSYLNTTAVTVGGTVEARNGLVVTVNGSPALIGGSGGSGGTSYSASGVALVEGQNRLVARATDPAGNQGVASVLVYRDTVAPQLASSNPASGAQAIGLNTVFQLTFSEPIATPAAGSWSLRTAAGQAIAASAALAGSTLTVTPSAALPAAASIQLALTGGITDLAGNALANPPVLAYTTFNAAAPAAPVVGSVPAALCAASVTLSGTAAAGSVIDVTGGAAAAQAPADATSGAFTVAVLLTPGSVNRLLVTAASATTGVVSPPATVQVVDDCAAPYVVGARLAGGGVVIAFDKPVVAATLAGAVTVTAPGGAVAGAVALSADGKTATFTPTPAGTALPGGVLRLDVSVAVQDQAGNALAYPFFQLFGGASETGASFLAGTAIDDSVGRPLAGALAMVTATNGAAVAAPQPQQLTGPDGTFSLALPAGTQLLAVTRPGYTPSYRTAAVQAAQGASVFAPRLTPAAGAQSVAPAGGTVTGTPAGGAVGSGGGAAPAAVVVIPGGSLAAATPVALTGLDEQGLPLPLPYGWSPRGAAWLDTGGATLSGTATLTLPVEEPNGSSLAVVWLSAVAAAGAGGGGVPSVQWQVVSAGATVTAGTVSVGVSGVADGGYAAVDPDTLSWAAAVPAAAVVGAALPPAPAPAGTEVSAATMAFNPSQVLPAQSSQATALYTVVSGGVASGMPLSLAVTEQLTLLDGTTRQEPPYGADLVLYHAADGTPRSRFQLAPSPTAQSLPISLGSDVAALRAYSGAGPAPGNVVGPGGGTYADADGDTVTVPAGALAQSTAVALTPVAAGDLALPAPAGTTLDGALRLDLGGQTLSSAAALTLALAAAPPAGSEGLLLEETDFGSGPVLRPVAALVASGAAWTTVAAAASDLPWAGVTQGAVYLFVRLGGPIGYVHGTVSQAGGAALAGAVVTGAGLGWAQQTAGDGTYVLPAPVGSVAVAALDPASGNSASGSATIAADQTEVELDLTVQAVPLAVVATAPADGATAVLLGIQPTVTFNRPIDATTVSGSSGGIQLLAGGAGGTPVPVDVTVAGAVATVAPQATLLPGTVYQLLVASSVRDLYGAGMAAAVSATFTTQTLTLPSSWNVARIFAVQPDDAGDATVLGQAAALPAGALVYVENTGELISTPSVTVGQDGSFNVTVAAELTDTLLLHVLVTGSNEVILPLGPFHTADLASALVDAGGESFATGAGVSVTVPAGAFSAATWVRVTPAQPSDPQPAPPITGLPGVYGYTLGFTSSADGSTVASAATGLQIGVPLPAGSPAPTGNVYLVQRAVTALGQTGWMLMDFATAGGNGQVITTTDPTTPQGGGATPAQARAARRARLAPAATAAAGGGGATTQAALEAGPAAPIVTRDQAQAAQGYLPGSALPGQYQMQAPQLPVGYYSLPISFGTDVGIWNSDLDNEVAVINQDISSLLAYDSVLIPTLLNRPATITVRDLSTGYILTTQTLAPPANSTPVVVPPEALGDGTPPLPVSGSPIRFFLIDLSAAAPPALDQGITVQSSAGNLAVSGATGAAQGGVTVRLVGVDDDVLATTTAGASGTFQLSQAVTAGNRYLLAIGAVVAGNQTLVLQFSKGLDSAHTDLDVLDSAGTSVAPVITGGATPAAVVVAPAVGWTAGQTYTLHLGPGLNDGLGDAWGKTLDVPFQASKGQVGSTYTLPVAYDMALVGSMLFVAADTKGLLVLDASNPASLTDLIPGGATFPLLFNDPVRGVAVTPHGLVLEVGGGVAGFGQLKIFDPLLLTPSLIANIAANPTSSTYLGAPLRGTTLLSDSLTNATTQLPEGTPRRVAPLSNDTELDWIAGSATPPGGVTLNPATPPTALAANGEYTLTVSGGGVGHGHPVSFFDRTLGRQVRADAAADGTFSLSLSVRPDDQLALLENANSLAYVATPGVGVEVVDLDDVYNSTASSGPPVLSAVEGIYSGFEDPNLLLCGQQVADLASVLEQVGVLFDAHNPHPLVVAGLVGNNGVVLLDSSLAAPGTLTFLNDICVNVQGSNAVTGMAVVQHYVFDWNGDGQLDPAKAADYIVVTHRTAGVLIYDVTDRTNPTLVGEIPLPGQAGDVTVDTVRRRLYVSGLAGGLYVVDFNHKPSIGLLDQNHDGTDDRVLQTITLPGDTDAPAFAIPALGMIYAGGEQRGVTGISVGDPQIAALAYNLPPPAGQAPAANQLNGGLRQVTQVAPFGVPTVSEGDNGQNQPALLRFQVGLPGSLGKTVQLDVQSMGPYGAPVAPAGNSAVQTNLPPVALTGAQGLVFTRLSDAPTDAGYNLYQSAPVLLLSDLKASQAYVRTADESDSCTRCDPAQELVPPNTQELLSGDNIVVRLPQALRSQLAPVYTADQLDGSQLTVHGVRWESAPTPYPEPMQNAAPQNGVHLHSGEMTTAAVDMTVAGRGMDFVLERTYHGQVVGEGPFGPGWDYNYNQRLRELPNGDVQLYDGRGRRQPFQKCSPSDTACQAAGQSGQPGQYRSPPGVFATLQKTAASFQLIDARHNLTQFDLTGRLQSIADAVKQDAQTGNQMSFSYDIAGHLASVTDTLGRQISFSYDTNGHVTQVQDFDGRAFTYQYDAGGRLTSVTTPTVVSVQFNGGDTVTTNQGGIVTTYGYDGTTGDLATTLNARGKLISTTDGKDQTWLQVSYADLHGSGHNDSVSTQNWATGAAQFTYDYDAHTATVTDPQGNPLQYTTTDAGQIAQLTDPAQATAQYTYDSEGLIATMTDPVGRVTTYTYDTGDDRRSRGNLTEAMVTPGAGSLNGAQSQLTTTTQYDAYSNQPVQNNDPRGITTTTARNAVGLPVMVTRAYGTAQQSSTQMTYDDFGDLVTAVDANGHSTVYSYSRLGYLQSVVVDPGSGHLNLTTTYTTDDRGNVTSMVDPRGVLFTRTYNALNWITSSNRAVSPSLDGAPALNYTTSYLYDANGNLVEEQLPVGDGSAYTRVRHIYGPLDELLVVAREVQPGDGWSLWSKTTNTYDLNLNLTQTIEPAGQITMLQYDDRNLPVLRVRGAGTAAAVTDSFQYDLDRRRIAYVDGLHGTWTTAYDGYGRVAQTTDPQGNHSNVTYDNDNEALTATTWQKQGSGGGDLLLAQREASYDLLGRRTALSTELWPHGANGSGLPSSARDLTTSYQYDPASNLVAVIDPLQRTTQFQYDAAERRIAATDPAGNVVQHDLDAAGNPVTMRTIEQYEGVGAPGTGGSVTVTATATFDALNRQATRTDGLGNTEAFTYDARNQLALSVDAEQNLTTQTWDGLNRLIKRVQPLGIEVDSTYDASSRLTAYTDALGNATTYAYDALNRLVLVTWPDHTTEQTAYDANGNATQITDPNGTLIQQVFDSLNRMTSRQGGALSESYVYDGMGRLTHAQSGNQTTDLTFNSLSRRTSESLGGKFVTYTYDDAGNETAIGYPSGLNLVRAFDPLDRLQSVGPTSSTPLATFGFRGPDLLAARALANGVTGLRQFDAADRMVDDWLQIGAQTGTPQTVMRESLAWSPRGLRSAQARQDLGGQGLAFAYDPAERLIQAAKSPAPLTLVPNNTAVAPPALAGLPDAFGYTYDVAQNLLARTATHAGVLATTALPLDDSGRNRPGSVSGVALVWDRNGNLIQKGNVHYSYDFRNRLTDVADGSNNPIAHYDYDAWNRRIAKTVAGDVKTTTWQGWHPIEDYDGSRLLQRRTYGDSLDDIVYLESDLDGTGTVATKSWPLYDSTGNLVLLTGPTGLPIERYDYTPYGTQTILVNSTPPAIEQVRVVGNAVWVELSEAVNPGPLAQAATVGTLKLFDNTLPAAFGALAVTQPVTTGDLAQRRLVLVGQPPGGFQPGDQVTLTIPAGALVDSFLNQPAHDYTLAFTWPSSDAVVADLAAPTVQRVTLQQGMLSVEFSAEPNLAAATAAIQLDGASLTWSLAADHYTLQAATPVAAGAHTLTIATTLTDAGNQPLAAPFSQTFTTVTAQDSLIVYTAPNPQLATGSALGNLFGYQGRNLDPETGLIYFRNRYYDPQLGRFISADPKGYVDGPSEYAFEVDDPANDSDPMGLERVEQEPDPKDKAAQKVQQEYRKAYEEFKKTPKGAVAAKTLEDDPSIKLTVKYSSAPPGKNVGAEVTNYKADEKGKIVSAELNVGPNFLRDINDPNYPNASKLKGSGREKQVYVVGHEEQGHFMSAVTDPAYASEAIRIQQFNATTAAAQEAAAKAFPNDPVKRVAEYQRLLGPKGLQESKDATAIHKKHENTADKKGQEFVEDIKNEKN